MTEIIVETRMEDIPSSDSTNEAYNSQHSLERRKEAPLFSAPRCLARTRSGMPCQSPAVKGKKRCRMHGGTNPGAPKGNRNALKHGRYSGAVLEVERDLRALLAKSLAGIDSE